MILAWASPSKYFCLMLCHQAGYICPLPVYPLQRWNIFLETMDIIFVQFDIIINVLVSSFRFIWIPLLLVYGH